MKAKRILRGVFRRVLRPPARRYADWLRKELKPADTEATAWSESFVVLGRSIARLQNSVDQLTEEVAELRRAQGVDGDRVLSRMED